MSNPPEPVFFKTLQAGRGMAAMLVMCFHFGFVPMGWAGVDFFFVLSGFIIFYANEKIIGQTQFAYTYFINRITRIYPIYWLIAGAYLAIHFLLGNISDFYNADFGGYLQSFLLLPNHPVILITSWTLSYEIFFYLFFMFLIISPFAFYLLYLWFFLCFFNLINLLFGWDFSLPVYLFNPLYLEFALGIWGFYLLKNDTLKMSRGFLLFFLFTSIILLFFCSFLFKTQRTIHAGLPCFGIVVSIVSLEKYHKINVPSFFILLGNASYCLYLLHTLLNAILIDLAKKVGLYAYLPSNILFLCFMCISTLAACLLYLFIEKPLIQYLRNLLLFKKTGD